MKFVPLSGSNRIGARRYASQASASSPEEVKDPEKLAEIIRQLSARLQELESRMPPEGVEFERNITGDLALGVDYRFEHNLGVPVRWYVVHSVVAAANPVLVYQTSSTLDCLVLKSHSIGRIILRIEPAQAGIT